LPVFLRARRRTAHLQVQLLTTNLPARVYAAGAKQWAVVHPVVHLPRTHDIQLDPKLLPHRTAVPFMNVSMQPGDVLYLPRGTLHFAVNDPLPQTTASSDGNSDALRAEASTHLTIAVAVQFWQTVEAALHVLLMKAWRPGMVIKRATPAVRAAMGGPIDMAQHPETGQLLGLPACLIMHSAIRNAANDASGDLRRAVLIGGKGNVTAATTALTSICATRPPVSDVIRGMLQWDPSMGNVSGKGLGSVVSVVRDLNELRKGANAETATQWQELVSTYDFAVDAATDQADPAFELGADQQAKSERVLAEAWNAFCSSVVSIEPKKLWKNVFKQLEQLESVKRAESHKRLEVGLDLHKITLHPAVAALLHTTT
jgi:hypothetical protein